MLIEDLITLEKFIILTSLGRALHQLQKIGPAWAGHPCLLYLKLENLPGFF